MDKKIFAASKALSQEFINFVNANPTAYHVTSYCRDRLLAAGFKELHETQPWSLEKGHKYFFTKNESTLMAFTVGSLFDPKTTGFKIIGGHTDSPCLKLAPMSQLEKNDFQQQVVCTYGGGLWHTWLDRDLTLAGKVVFKHKGRYQTAIWHAKKPLVKIPNLAIHLQTAAERGKLDLNNETHLKPIIATKITESLFPKEKSEEDPFDIQKKHHVGLLGLIARDLSINIEDIVDLDLNFADTQVMD